MTIKLFYYKYRLKILAAFISVVVIMFFPNFYVFNNSTQAVYQQARENNLNAINIMIDSFDESFKKVNSLMYTIYGINYDMFDGSNSRNFNYLNAYFFMSETKKLTLPDYIYDYIVYSNGSSNALNSEGTGNFNDLIKRKFRNSKYAPEYWENFAVTSHALIMVPAAEYTSIDGNMRSTTHRLLAIVGNNLLNNERCDIIVFIDVDKLLKSVSNQTMMDGSSLVIMDQNKNILLSTNDKYEDDLINEVYFGNGTSLSGSKSDYEYNIKKSDYNGCIYISKIPKGIGNLITLLKINRIIVILAAFVALVMAFILSTYLYRPVKNILALVGTKGNLKEGDSDYSGIYSSIEYIKKENVLVKSQIDLMADDVRRSLFFKLVDDTSNVSKLKNQIEKYFTGIFSSKKYIIAAFQLELCNKNRRKDIDAKIPPPDEMLAAIQEKLNETFVSSTTFYMEKMMFVVLVGADDSTGRQGIIKNISSITSELYNDLNHEYNIISAVSKFHTEIEECREAFRDIKMCLAHRNIKTKYSIIDAEKPDFNCDVYFPPEYAEILSNNILSGNSEDSITLIDRVIDTNIQNNITYINFTNILSSIFYSIINTMGLYGFDRQEMHKLEIEFHKKLNDAGDFEDVGKFLKSTIKQITEKISLKRQSKLNKEFILEYINLHYNEELYLEKMAEITGTSTKYFSNFFKKSIGINFIEYLTKVRIKHAKELLIKTDISVSSVGQRVGLPVPGTFANTFKKYCGVSPAEYRRECRQ